MQSQFEWATHEEELLHYSVLIASYAQGAILLCIVGQELHDHQQVAQLGRCHRRQMREEA
jgi:hypothetical protein